MLLPAPTGVSNELNKRLNEMQDGGIKLIPKTDILLCDYAAKFLATKGLQKKAYIRKRIRKVARFLMEMRRQTPGLCASHAGNNHMRRPKTGLN